MRYLIEIRNNSEKATVTRALEKLGCAQVISCGSKSIKASFDSRDVSTIKDYLDSTPFVRSYDDISEV